MIATTRKRTCRTCPAIISEHGETGQCRACQSRSAAVREAVKLERTDSNLSPPRQPACETDGHHACRHFLAVYAYVKKLLADSDYCPVCNVDAEGDDDIVHKLDCALIKLMNAEAGVAEQRRVG